MTSVPTMTYLSLFHPIYLQDVPPSCNYIWWSLMYPSYCTWCIALWMPLIYLYCHKKLTGFSLACIYDPVSPSLNVGTKWMNTPNLMSTAFVSNPYWIPYYLDPLETRLSLVTIIWSLIISTSILIVVFVKYDILTVASSIGHSFSTVHRLLSMNGFTLFFLLLLASWRS